MLSAETLVEAIAARVSAVNLMMDDGCWSSGD